MGCCLVNLLYWRSLLFMLLTISYLRAPSDFCFLGFAVFTGKILKMFLQFLLLAKRKITFLFPLHLYPDPVYWVSHLCGSMVLYAFDSLLVVLVSYLIRFSCCLIIWWKFCMPGIAQSPDVLSASYESAPL